jgi:hypothetical protein
MSRDKSNCVTCKATSQTQDCYLFGEPYRSSWGNGYRKTYSCGSPCGECLYQSPSNQKGGVNAYETLEGNCFTPCTFTASPFPTEGQTNWNVASYGLTVNKKDTNLTQVREPSVQMGGYASLDANTNIISKPQCPRNINPGTYTCNQQQCKNGQLDISCANKSNLSQVCGNKLRCGNGDIATKPTKGCNCVEPVTGQIIAPPNPTREYGVLQSNRVGWVSDLSQPPIGNRPVIVQSDDNNIPEMLLCDHTNLAQYQFDCMQPCWNEKCI